MATRRRRPRHKSRAGAQLGVVAVQRFWDRVVGEALRGWSPRSGAAGSTGQGSPLRPAEPHCAPLRRTMGPSRHSPGQPSANQARPVSAPRRRGQRGVSIVYRSSPRRAHTSTLARSNSHTHRRSLEAGRQAPPQSGARHRLARVWRGVALWRGVAAWPCGEAAWPR